MELIKWRQIPNWRLTNEMKLNSYQKKKTHTTHGKWNENSKWIKHSQLCKMEKFCVLSPFWVSGSFFSFGWKNKEIEKMQLFSRRNPICVIWLTWYEMHKQCTLHSVQRSHLHNFQLLSSLFVELTYSSAERTFEKVSLVLFAIHFSTWCAQLWKQILFSSLTKYY